jgi:hypothetical protein
VAAFAPSHNNNNNNIVPTCFHHGNRQRLGDTTTMVQLKMTLDDHDFSNNRNRRQVLLQSGIILLLSSLFPSHAAHAAKQQQQQEDATEPTTLENVKAAFGDLEFELHDSQGGIRAMQDYIDRENFPALLEFTKTYDGVLRKQKWGRCKAFFGNAEKEVATLQGNAVTFDLIGINRASRSGKESAEKANRYLNELRVDLQNMIDMESKIQMVGDESFEAYYQSIKGK